jgi:hypothetical protein
LSHKLLHGYSSKGLEVVPLPMTTLQHHNLSHTFPL